MVKLILPQDSSAQAIAPKAAFVHWPNYARDYSEVFYEGQTLGKRVGELVAEGLTKGIMQAKEHLNLGDIQVTVFVDRNNLLLHPEYELGIGGFACGPQQVLIALNPGAKHFEPTISWHLPSTLSHEFHHACRMAALNLDARVPYEDNPVYGTLGRALVTEGLAVKFQEELGYPRYVLPGALEKLEDMSRIAQHQLSGPYDFSEWFQHNSNTTIFPYIGYEIGFTIVQGWLHHENVTAAQAFSVEHQKVLSWWQENGYVLDAVPTAPVRDKSFPKASRDPT